MTISAKKERYKTRKSCNHEYRVVSLNDALEGLVPVLAQHVIQ